MAGEIPPPPSDESRENLPLSPGEQKIMDEIERNWHKPVEPQIDDKKRPLPPEEEWGVPKNE